MKLRTLFFVFCAMLLATAVLLLMVSNGINRSAFYLAEGFLALCVCFSVYFYAKIIKIINSLGNGMDLLNEQDFSSRLARVGQYDADRIVEVFNRMMSQLKSESLKLHEQSNFLNLIIKSSPMGVVILNFDNEITSINRAALQFLGYSNEQEVLSRHIDSLSTPLAIRLKSVPQDATETLRIGDAMTYRCSRLSFIDRGFHHPFILIESLTAEVMKAEKKAYEKVIRMIAHEVNNSVAGVTSAMSTVGEVLGDYDNTSEMKELIKVCVERCYSMSGFITRFADVVRIPEPQMCLEDLNNCVSRSKIFMESMCSDREIELALELCEDELPVKIDSALIEQVLVNIIKNSMESIAGKGVITIKTYPGEMPTLEVVDNGRGIDSDTADKLFTPFFSTKPNGQGLGLIFIREVLLKHNCRFSLRTHSDGLTRFQIHFPKMK